MKDMKINPVYKKEVKTNTRSIKFLVMVIIFNILLMLGGLTILYDVIDLIESSANINYTAIGALYQLLTITEFILMLFMMSAMTSSAISGERERQTLDILLSTKLTAANIIIGKLASSVHVMTLVIISGLPVMSIVFIFGGISFRDIIEITAYLIFATFFIGTLGITLSTMLKRTAFATAITYGSVLFFCLGTLVLIAILMSGTNSPDAIKAPGWTLMLLLINPSITLLELVNRQLGDTSRLFIFESGIEISLFLKTHWIILSVMVQSIISAILLRFSFHKLNPLKKKVRLF